MRKFKVVNDELGRPTFDVRMLLADGSSQLEVVVASPLVESYLGITAAHADDLLQSSDRAEQRARMAERFETFFGVFWAECCEIKTKSKNKTSKPKVKLLVTLTGFAEDDVKELCSMLLKA
jgi:hypothetical protein